MEKKQVSIIIHSSQDGNAGEPIDFFTVGEYYQDNDTHVINYRESEISGLDGTETTLKIKPDGILLERHGNYRMCQNFQVDRRDFVTYSTPYGDLLVEILPTLVESNWSKEGGQINLSYFLYVGGQEMGKHNMSISITGMDD